MIHDKENKKFLKSDMSECWGHPSTYDSDKTSAYQQKNKTEGKRTENFTSFI